MPWVSGLLEPALIERLNQLQLSARRVVEGSTSGLHRSALKGASVEFRQHRFYVPGDDPRRLDWRVLARTNRPYVKEYDEETNLRCAMLLDSSGSMSYRGAGTSKFDYASRLVASLAYLMLANTEGVGLAMCAGKLEGWIAPHSGTAQLSRIVEMLERGNPAGPSGLARAMQGVADRLGRRALVIIVSDFFLPIDQLHKGLARLTHDRHELILLQVVDEDEMNFPFASWARFRGLEGEAARLCDPAVMKETYLANFRKHQKQLSDICRSARIERALFNTREPLLESLTRFLRHRQ